MEVAGLLGRADGQRDDALVAGVDPALGLARPEPDRSLLGDLDLAVRRLEGDRPRLDVEQFLLLLVAGYPNAKLSPGSSS